MFNRFTYNLPLYNENPDGFSALPTTVSDSGATRSPFGHTVVVAPTALVFIYQSGGSDGLVYRVSSDGGQTWGAPRSISSRTSVYASAVVNYATNDIHIVYSAHGTPLSAGDTGVYYRPLIWDATAQDWVTGAEQILAGDGSLYDPDVADRRNAVISANPNGRLVITYLRNSAGVITWSALISKTVWAVADMYVDVDLGVIADEDTRGAGQQTRSGTTDLLWLVSHTGSTYSLARALLFDPLSTADAIDASIADTWLGDSGEMVAIAYASETDQLGIMYLFNSKPRFRLYTLGGSPTLISDTEISTNAAQSVSIAWDGSKFWLGWVTNDVVRLSTSDNPTVEYTTFSNPGPNEAWSWLNTSASLRESGSVVFVWSQTNGGSANRVYIGSFPVVRALSGSESGIGSNAATVGIVGAESGTGSDSLSATQSISTPSESGSGADTLSVNVILIDAGDGTDVVGKNPRESESGAGADSLHLSIGASESGTHADSLSVQELKDLLDSGGGLEAAVLRLTFNDRGAGDDSASSTGASNDETGSGIDAMLVGLLGSDSGGSADALEIYLTLSDSASGGDALDNINKGGNADSGVGSDSMLVYPVLADAGVGVDALSSTRVVIADSGLGVDTATGGSAAVVSTAVTIRLLFAGGYVRLKMEG